MMIKMAIKSFLLKSIKSDNFLLQHPKTDFCKGSLAISGPAVWNYLPSNVKNGLSVGAFHNR